MAFEIAHPVDGRKHAAREGVIGGHIGAMHQQQEIIIAGNLITSDNLRLALHTAFKCLLHIVVLAFEVNLDKDADVQADCLRRDDGGLADDDALFGQVFDAPQASGTGKWQ